MREMKEMEREEWFREKVEEEKECLEVSISDNF